MSDVRALVQDLRAEAHTVPDRVARLMRRAAAELELTIPDDPGQRIPFPPPMEDAHAPQC